MIYFDLARSSRASLIWRFYEFLFALQLSTTVAHCSWRRESNDTRYSILDTSRPLSRKWPIMCRLLTCIMAVDNTFRTPLECIAYQYWRCGRRKHLLCLEACRWTEFLRFFLLHTNYNYHWFNCSLLIVPAWNDATPIPCRLLHTWMQLLTIPDTNST